MGTIGGEGIGHLIRGFTSRQREIQEEDYAKQKAHRDELMGVWQRVAESSDMPDAKDFAMRAMMAIGALKQGAKIPKEYESIPATMMKTRQVEKPAPPQDFGDQDASPTPNILDLITKGIQQNVHGAPNGAAASAMPWMNIAAANAQSGGRAPAGGGGMMSAPSLLEIPKLLGPTPAGADDPRSVAPPPTMVDEQYEAPFRMFKTDEEKNEALRKQNEAIYGTRYSEKTDETLRLKRQEIIERTQTIRELLASGANMHEILGKMPPDKQKEYRHTYLKLLADRGDYAKRLFDHTGDPRYIMQDETGRTIGNWQSLSPGEANDADNIGVEEEAQSRFYATPRRPTVVMNPATGVPTNIAWDETYGMAPPITMYPDSSATTGGVPGISRNIPAGVPAATQGMIRAAETMLYHIGQARDLMAANPATFGPIKGRTLDVIMKYGGGTNADPGEVALAVKLHSLIKTQAFADGGKALTGTELNMSKRLLPATSDTLEQALIKLRNLEGEVNNTLDNAIRGMTQRQYDAQQQHYKDRVPQTQTPVIQRPPAAAKPTTPTPAPAPAAQKKRWEDMTEPERDADAIAWISGAQR